MGFSAIKTTSQCAHGETSPEKPRGPILMQKLGLRSYSPGLARWLNRDPIGEQGGANLMAPAENDFVNRIDPLGLKPKVNCCEIAKKRAKEKYGSQLALLKSGDPPCLVDIICSDDCGGKGLGRAGVYLPGKGTICIEPDNMEATWKTLLHELQHAQDNCRRGFTSCRDCIRGEARAQRCSKAPLAMEGVYAQCAALCHADTGKQFTTMYGKDVLAEYNKTKPKDCWYGAKVPAPAVPVPEEPAL